MAHASTKSSRKIAPRRGSAAARLVRTQARGRARNPHQQQDPKQQAPKPPFREPPQSAPGLQERMREAPDCGAHSYVGHGRLQDKIAIVTGGDSGIGRAVALAYAREGADVVVAHLAVEESDAQETQRLVEGAGRACLLVAGDLAHDRACAALIQKAVARFGRIDVLVNNAAFQGKAVERFEDLSAENVEHTFAVNIVAMFHLVRHALPHMKEGGSIINVASVQAYKPSHEILSYAATKGAIVTFTKGLSRELIERGIRVNAVAPGPVWTPLIAQSFGPKKIRHFGEDAPMKRPAQPAELAPAFVFLASQDARYVVGEVLGVTGGKPLP